MKKRTFKFVAIAVLIVVCLTATTLLAACNNKDSYYLSGSFNDWTTYGRGDSIPDGVRLSKGNDDLYSVTVQLDAGDSFAIRKTNSNDVLVSEIFTSTGELTLGSDGKITVAKAGTYVLKLDMEDGVLTYTFTPAAGAKTVSSVTVTPTNFTISAGEHQQLIATVTYTDNTSDSDVTWTSGDNNVATVDDDGLVTAVAEGSTTITARAGDKDATTNVTVVDGQLDPPDEIYFVSGSLTLMETEQSTVAVGVYPDNTDKSFTYEVVSGDESVASFDILAGALKVTALKVGTVTIKPISTRNPSAESYPLTITVTELTLQLSISPSSLTLQVGETENLVANVLPANASVSLTWTSSNEACVSVDQTGKVTAVNSGTSTITVRDNGSGVSATCAVTVVQPVSSISLSETSVVAYIGGSVRNITVTINPGDATNKGFTVSVEQNGNIIAEPTVSGMTISITGLTEGSATLTVTSEENSEITATCEITVQSLDAAVPYLSASRVEIPIGMTSDNVQVLLDGSGSITNFTTTVATSTITSVTKGSGNSFTLEGLDYGTTTVTVTVTYSGGSVTLSLEVCVGASFFYLTGPFDGLTNWPTYSSETDARTANRLMDKVSDGVYEITRDFTAGDKTYVLPAELDSDWNYGLKSGYYTAHSSASGYGIEYETDNMQFTYSGNYTVRLTLTGTKAAWTVIVNYIAPTSASIAADYTTLQEGSSVTSANLTLTIGPALAQVDASNITWSVPSQYSNWLVLTPGNDGMSCVATLNYIEGNSDVHVLVTATVKVGNFTVTATRDIVLMPQGASETPVSSIDFDKTEYEFLVESDGWSFAVSAHVNSDATNQDVTYSIVNGANVLYNGISGSYAFSIDSEKGLITAKQFGTITVRATSAGDSTKYVEIDVLISSQTFVIAGVFGEKLQDEEGKPVDDWSAYATNYTSSTSTSEYVWSNVTLYSNDVVIILYNTGDWDNGVIRSGGYLNSASTSGAVSGTTGSSGKFTINTTGVYTITLDLSGTAPSVKFILGGEVVEPDTWSATVSVYIMGEGSSWSDDPYASAENQTISNENPTVTITATLSGFTVDYPNIQFVVGTTYYGEGSTLEFSGNKYSTTNGATGKWYGWDAGDDYAASGARLCFGGTASTLASTSFTFVFTFNSAGILTAVSID